MIEPTFDLVSLFILVGLIQAFFLSVFFISHRADRPQNFLAGLMLIIIGLLSVDIFLEQSGYITRVIYLYNASQPFALLFGPLFYFWIKFSLKQNQGRWVWIHFIPFLSYLGYYFFFYLQPNSFKEFAYARNQGEIDVGEVVTISFHPDPLGISEQFNNLHILILIFYLFLSIQLIKKSSFEGSGRLLNRTIVIVIVAYVTGIVLQIVSRFYFSRDLGDFIPAMYITVLTYLVSFSVMKNSSFFKENPLLIKRRYSKARLPEEIALKIEKKLRDSFVNEKIFTQPNLTVAVLSRHLNVSSHHLSQVLNEYIGQSFFDFVAEHRVEEACNMLLLEEYKKATIETIANLVGYNSKSSFIQAFKKLKGTTPSEYRDQ